MGYKIKRWSNEEIVSWAELYTRNRTTTLMDLEGSIGVSHSTIWWCFTHRLESINEDLYWDCINQFILHHSGRRYIKR